MPVNIISGTEEADSLFGEEGRDKFLALAGDDWIVTTQGPDTVDCGSGNDTVFAYTGGALLLGGEGNDQLVTSDFDATRTARLLGGQGDDWIVAGSGNDRAYGGLGDDTVTVYFREAAHAEGGRGVDTLSLQVFAQGAQVSDDRVVLALSGSDAGVQIGITGFLTLDGFERLQTILGAGDDYVRAGDLDDSIDLGRGLNTALALDGDDFVSYRTGAQNGLSGGDGRDLLQIIQSDRDQALTLIVEGRLAHDQHNSFISDFEDYAVYAGHQGDTVVFGAGDDHLQGLHGDDSAQGQAGNDSLAGGAGDDMLKGGTGDDHLSGGAGIDILTGGAGADSFRFLAPGAGQDLITDFQAGQDLLVFSRFGLGTLLPRGALEAARFSLGAASGDLAQFVYRGGTTADENDLVWDSNGAAAGGEVLIARFTGLPDLDANSFLIL